MDKNFDKIIADILLKNGLATQETVDQLLQEKEKCKESLVCVLAKRSNIPEEKILALLSLELKIPFVELKNLTVDKSVIERVPVKFASWYKFFPLKVEGNILTVAVSAPLDIKVQDEVRLSLGFELKYVLSREADIIDMLKVYYGLGAETVESLLSGGGGQKPDLGGESSNAKVEDIEKLAGDASVIKLVNQIILDAYKRRATDIHIEPFRDKIRIRYRIDGILYDANVPPEIKVFLKAILSRIKIMSNLNIVEHRLPQDGRAIVKVQEQNLDLRISCIPTEFGESMVIRILPTVMMYDIVKLGMAKEDLEKFQILIRQPNGIIFVTGPTGSGKTTTLYAAISTVNTSQRKVITIEDPIEYEINGVMQIQIMTEIGFDFPMALRSILRHDPDIVMIGEVRDLASAEIAIRISLTGHLVFSTLHTNDTASGVSRLIDLGIEPYLVASSIRAFIAQRLIRVICPKCKDLDKTLSGEIKVTIAKEMGLGLNSEIKTYRGKGCNACNNTGFFGRTAIYEILMVDSAITELILKKVPADQIKQLAIRRGMKTLRQDGWNKVLAGVTTPEEIMNVTQDIYSALGTMTTQEVSTPVENLAKKDEGQVNYQEKRGYLRLNKNIPVRYKVLKTQAELSKSGYSKEYTGQTANISGGGILFFAEEPIPVSAILELNIEMPDNKGEMVCLSKVIRVTEIISKIDQKPLYWDVAVCFLDISSADRARMEKYVSKELGSSEEY